MKLKKYVGLVIIVCTMIYPPKIMFELYLHF